MAADPGNSFYDEIWDTRQDPERILEAEIAPQKPESDLNMLLPSFSLRLQQISSNQVHGP